MVYCIILDGILYYIRRYTVLYHIVLLYYMVLKITMSVCHLQLDPLPLCDIWYHLSSPTVVVRMHS
jgi:hypothetical protein